MKVTVIATGFQAPRPEFQLSGEFMEQPVLGELPLTEFSVGEPPRRETPAEPLVASPPSEQQDKSEEIPFYRKVLAHARGDDPGGYGPNWSNVDDFDIPTVLRKQMD
jgi:hypothetical protein